MKAGWQEIYGEEKNRLFTSFITAVRLADAARARDSDRQAGLSNSNCRCCRMTEACGQNPGINTVCDIWVHFGNFAYLQVSMFTECHGHKHRQLLIKTVLYDRSEDRLGEIARHGLSGGECGKRDCKGSVLVV